MKLNNKQSFCLLIVLGITNISIVKADNLGRLYTTPEQRQLLEKERNYKPEPEKVRVVEEPEVVEVAVPVVEEKELGSAITVKGLVQRSDGKNTAWLNESNTFEGDLESQYIKVDDNEITQEHVEITMPDNKTKIKLKVGDNYDPNSGSEL